MAEKQILGFEPAAGLEQVADEYCERKMIAFSYLGMTDHCAVIT
jgi:hypothetical protein